MLTNTVKLIDTANILLCLIRENGSTENSKEPLCLNTFSIPFIATRTKKKPKTKTIQKRREVERDTTAALEE